MSKSPSPEPPDRSGQLISIFGTAILPSTFAAIFIGVWGGMKLDAWLHTDPWFTVILSLGVSAGLYSVLKEFIQPGKNEKIPDHLSGVHLSGGLCPMGYFANSCVTPGFFLCLDLFCCFLHIDPADLLDGGQKYGRKVSAIHEHLLAGSSLLFVTGAMVLIYKSVAGHLNNLCVNSTFALIYFSFLGFETYSC